MAGLGRRTFQAGEVLTASNVMGYLQDQAVMNFAGTAARGSAIASPSEGMVTYLADADSIEIYDGTSWKSQNPGLIPIIPTSVTAVGGTGSFSTTTGTITVGTGMTSITVNGVFTSAYKNYLIVGEVLKSADASNTFIAVQMSNSGTPVTVGYNTANIGFAESNASIQNLGTANGFYLTRTYQASKRSFGIMTISSPFLTQATTYSGSGYGTTLGDTQGLATTGTLNNTTSYSDIRFTQSANSWSGTINIYGLKG